MAIIKKSGSTMGLPMNITRGNPIPLDSTTIWYSFQEAQDYARNGATAYVGQLISVVDETLNQATVYVIGDTAGTLINISSSSNLDEDTIILYGGSASELIPQEEVDP